MTKQTVDHVIEGGYCVGCGGCAAMAPQDFTMRFTETGMFTAQALRAPQERAGDVSSSCPIAGESPTETQIAADLYPQAAVHDQIGRYAMTAVGWAEESDWRDKGSSGGLLTWIAAELLATGAIDEVVQVAPTQSDHAQLFAFRVSRTVEEIRDAAKSRYYPVCAVDAITHIRQSGQRTLFVGLPCFVKMIRLLARMDPVLNANLCYTLGLVCGHLKSAGFGEILAWQIGIPPKHIATEDFRVKVEGHPASSYGFSAQDARTSQTSEAMMKDLLGKDWGQGMMKYKACDFCDDVLAECADIAIGDAWVEPWKDEWRGANICVVRHPDILALLQKAAAAGRVHLHEVAADVVAQSQASGLRHRREGLAWRLWRDQAAGHWVPRKRVAPNHDQSRQRKAIYNARDRLRDDSHVALLAAKEAGRFEVFVDKMQPAIAQYAKAQRPPLSASTIRTLRLIQRKAGRALGRVRAKISK